MLSLFRVFVINRFNAVMDQKGGWALLLTAFLSLRWGLFDCIVDNRVISFGNVDLKRYEKNRISQRVRPKERKTPMKKSILNHLFRSNVTQFFVLCVLSVSLNLQGLAIADGLPDLQVTTIGTNSQCQMVVTIVNNGPGPLPTSAYDPITGVAIRFDVNGQAKDAYHLNFLDPNKRLLKPNSTLTWTHSAMVIQTSTSYSVHVDYSTVVNEVYENNNVKSAMWPDLPNCTPAAPTDLPDLEITSMTFDPLCRVVLTIKNNGPGPVPDSAYDLSLGSTVRYFTNTENLNQTGLAIIDPNKILKTPGASVTWVNNYFNFPGTDLVFAWVDAIQNVYETDENNNFKSRHHSNDTSCRPDIRVADLHLDEQCRVIVTLENAGSVRLPSEAWHPTQGVVVKMEKDGQNWLGFYLHNVDPGAHLMAPGNSIQVTYLAMEDDTSEHIRATADFTNVLHDGNGFNNVMARTLTCGPDGTPVDSGASDSGSGGPTLIIREIESMDTLTPKELRTIEKTMSLKTPRTTKQPIKPELGLSPAPAKPRKIAAVPAKKPTLKMKPRKKVLPPDLSVEEIKSNKKGRVIVTIKNKGRGFLTAEAYKAKEPFLELKKGKKTFGKWKLAQIDPAKKLRKPGGTLTWTVPKLHVTRSETIRVEINKYGKKKDAKTKTDSLEKVLTVTPASKVSAPAVLQEKAVRTGIKRGTSNIERPTSNVERKSTDLNQNLKR